MVGAIDFMNIYLTPQQKKTWDDFNAIELKCRMEASTSSGLGSYTPEQMLAQMDEAGVETTFLVCTFGFSYWNKKFFVEPDYDAVANITKKYPGRFVGLAGYNPFRIESSLKELERAVNVLGFKGVFVHIYGFDIPLDDKKMYPLYAKCVELDVPVSMQVGYVLEAMPSDNGRPIFLDRIALDFPSLKMVGAHTGYPWCEELIALAYKYDNVYFGVDAHMPKYLDQSVVRFIGSRGMDKCLWGTNGLPYKPVLDQIEALGLREEAKRKLLRENAIKVFKLDQH